MLPAKSTIRKIILHHRRLLSESIFQERNRSVVLQAQQLIRQQKCIHVFLPIHRNREVDTWPLVERMKDQVKIVVSATDFQRQTMTHFYYSDDLVFKNDRFDIPTPAGGEVADLANVDLILIPLIAADRQGNRIGYGKGYYDRLLTEMPEKVIKVGLSLAPLFDLFSFAAPHDIPMDYCVTPQGVIQFQD